MEKTVLHNKYSLVKGAARRARQLQGGAPPTIAATSMKACRVAQDEIRQGQVGYTLQSSKRAEVAVAAEPVLVAKPVAP